MGDSEERHNDEVQDKEWEWVAQSYHATPITSGIDPKAFADRLMEEVDIKTTTLPSKRVVLPHDLPHRRVVPRSLWGGFATALILVFAGGLWIGRTSVRNELLAGREAQASPSMLAQENPQPSTIPVASTTNRTVQFVLSSRHASRVTLVGDFNGWDVDATPMVSRPGSGLWTVSVPLPTGRHVYAFVVDGDEWVADPAAPQVAVDAFGSQNSVVIVGGAI